MIGLFHSGLGGYGYLWELQWWVGLMMMGLGELCNFAAYGFAPASVVTPLGALSVLVRYNETALLVNNYWFCGGEFLSTLLAVKFLGEKLNIWGKIGCLLTIFGSAIIVIHAPKDSELNSLFDFARQIGSSGKHISPLPSTHTLSLCFQEFLFFSSFTCFILFCLITYYGPRLGSKYVHIYILICSLLGAFTVTACKGLGVGLKELFTAEYTYSRWLTFFCAIVILFCIIIQMIYLNRALDLFSTPIVTTIYYVLFTTCVLITSGILFHEWKKFTSTDLTACLAGFLISTCGLILINYFKANLPSTSKY